MARQRLRPETVIGLLPGSRRQELENNFASQLRAAAHIHRQRPDTRFLVACFRKEHGDLAVRQLRSLFPCDSAPFGSFEEGMRGGWSLPIEVCVGRTPEIIQLAHSCVAVSGSVGLELLFRGKPTVVLYRSNLPAVLACRLLKKCRFISLVNLLAEQELFPEYVSHRCKGTALGEHVLHWLDNPGAYAALGGELAALRERVAEAGACERAARRILATLAEEGRYSRVA